MLEDGHCPVMGSIADVRLGDSRTFQDGAAAYAMLPSKSEESREASAQRKPRWGGTWPALTGAPRRLWKRGGGLDSPPGYTRAASTVKIRKLR